MQVTVEDSRGQANACLNLLPPDPHYLQNKALANVYAIFYQLVSTKEFAVLDHNTTMQIVVY